VSQTGLVHRARSDRASRACGVAVCCYGMPCQRDGRVNQAAYVGAGLAGALLGWPTGGAGSSAYLPLPVAIAVSPHPGFAAAAFAVAFAVPFAVALVRNQQQKE
jgi:hypothetical protein